jgi:hypothetical protein
VRLVLNVLGRRDSYVFLIKPHGVSLAADSDSLVLESGRTGSVVITGTARSGEIPGGYLPHARVTDCSPSAAHEIGEVPQSPQRSTGRWVFPVHAQGRGQCTLLFGLADDTVRVALTVTGKTQLERIIAEHSRD